MGAGEPDRCGEEEGAGIVILTDDVLPSPAWVTGREGGNKVY
ncbi:hypothetical protein SACS_0305 [Parasaccharibacter apium]|uniref:Uncharacterized protein n=1 Tax=Parasaccharibacter apium TaxID=1510841 RepID=A0A7U7G4L0_9PROT|nr:hypothetical protein SACS_0305 [Parasaccharibacter apium]